jgi:carbamoylphosphate synthase large subunit
LKPARGRVCDNREELLAFISEVGYPVVAKPNIGVGAAKTFKICSECEIDNYLAEKLPEEYIIEEYCEGQIVTYDGLVDGNGDVVFSSSLRYSRGVMDVVNEDSDIYYHTVRTIEPELEAAGIATLKAFDMRKRFFHLEFFMNEGTITPLEVNIRPPGGLTLNMMNYTFDADCYRTWANLIVNGVSEPMGERSHLVFYVGRKDRIPYQITHQQVLEKCSSVMMHHERLNDVFSLALGNYGYLLRHEEMEPLLEATELIQRRG